MFELSVAFKYLIPRWRQLSVSIISLVSMLVIALVVWLIVVFFSVKDGLESSWIDKLIALTAPIRITPTEKYYQSYYYQIDGISSHSDYTHKTIGEKLIADNATPYDPAIDEEPPTYFPKPDFDKDGRVKDLVKLVNQAVATLPEIKGGVVTDYEMTAANLKLKLIRPDDQPVLSSKDHQQIKTQQTEQQIEQAAYLGSFDPNTSSIAKTLLPLSPADLYNLIEMQLSLATPAKQQQTKEGVDSDQSTFQSPLKSLFESVIITKLKTPQAGWRLPVSLIPDDISLQAVALLKSGHVAKIWVPTSTANLSTLVEKLNKEGIAFTLAEIRNENGEMKFTLKDKEIDSLISPWTQVLLSGETPLNATLIQSSLETANLPADIQFHVHFDIQGSALDGVVPLGHLEIKEIVVSDTTTPASFAKIASESSGLVLPVDRSNGEAILVPKSYKEGGVLVGDTGFLSYYSPTPSSVQEQRTPVYVAGFYDPGIMPIGGKYILASRNLTGLIRASYGQQEALPGNGFNVRFNNISDAPRIKAALLKAFQQEGISPYWTIETYQEYDFTKDIIQQLHSEKNLFSLISMVIIIVACSNIISMLIILVNDKKVEIGILRSMGATAGSIAAIFGLCGMVMGAIGSIIGVLFAILTLHNLEFLVGMISRIQGYDLFNPVFYGNTLPNEISPEVLGYVILATAGISLLAGVVPAVKASMLRPSTILRSE